MTENHRPYWRHFIDSVSERDLSGKVVLNFGCNRGGFLRLLHEMRRSGRPSASTSPRMSWTPPMRSDRLSHPLPLWPRLSADDKILFRFEKPAT